MKYFLLLFTLLSFGVKGQKLIYNTDIKRGNVNQWIDTASQTRTLTADTAREKVKSFYMWCSCPTCQHNPNIKEHCDAPYHRK